jgi:hypothetical protein
MVMYTHGKTYMARLTKKPRHCPNLTVNGHWEIRLGGLVFSGLAATSFPGWWPRVLPAGGG